MSRLPFVYAARSLRREPALVAGVVLTFALAIGANAAMFGLVSRLLLPTPPGVTDPARVVRVALNYRMDDGEEYAQSTTSYPLYRALASLNDAWVAVAAVVPSSFIMGRGADALEVSGIAASGQYFTVLGARPKMGRFFGPSDDELPAGNPVAVLSYSFWKRQFAGRADIVGQSVVLDGLTFNIVGVPGPGFSGDALSAVDVFVPLTAALRNRPSGWWNEPDINLVSVIARMQKHITPPSAAGLATGRAKDFGGRQNRLTSITLESLVPGAVRGSAQTRIALWLFGVSLVVLVIATANVGTLLLLRAIRKRRDVAVRMALGASRGRLAAQLTTETLLLALGGGAAGLLVSQWVADIVRVSLMPDLAPSDRFVDGRVLLVTMVLSIGAGVVAGLAPIFLIAQRNLVGELHGAGTLGTASRARTQRWLVGVQVALTTVLLVGAGLFVQSLRRVQSQELGFSTSNLLYVTLDFREQLTGTRRDELYVQAAQQLNGVPGVTGATIAQAMPFGPHHVPPISVPGMSEPPSAGGQLPMMYGATPMYLKLMGVSLLQGRLLGEQDRRGSALVVLVNETMAREVWPGQSAIGKCIRAGFDPAVEPGPLAPSSLPCREVVGIVRDSRARSLRPVGREASLMQFYVPFDQIPSGPFDGAAEVSGLLVGVSRDVERMMPSVQRLIQGSSASTVYARVRQYQDLLDPQLRPWRLGATLFVALGALAVSIAAVGLFGVVSYLVTQRTREIGVRLALGGTASSIGRSVVIEALRLVGIGVAVGIGIALGIGPVARALLFETSPHDIAVLLSATLALAGVTVVAAAVPAWRAARVSPMTALRVD